MRKVQKKELMIQKHECDKNSLKVFFKNVLVCKYF